MSLSEFDNVCTKYEALLEDYISGELAPVERERVETHLHACAGCSEAVRFGQLGQRLLRRSAEPAAEASAFFAPRVMAAIRAEEENSARSSFWRPFETLALRAAWSASAALVLLLAYGAVSGIPSRPVAADMRAADNIGLFPDNVGQTVNPEDVLTYAGDSSNGK
ncbi:MAG TPA: zf-HC2 domain-containing protein [Candidatus Acidoferrales bacterium]|nr:zf-HC2 domain-containing protein [Candidatus Acidoferrales bacterium]